MQSRHNKTSLRRIQIRKNHMTRWVNDSSCHYKITRVRKKNRDCYKSPMFCLQKTLETRCVCKSCTNFLLLLYFQKNLFRESKVSQETGREITCLEENARSDESRLCCDYFIHYKKFQAKKQHTTQKTRLNMPLCFLLLWFVVTINFKSVRIILKFWWTFSLTIT